MVMQPGMPETPLKKTHLVQSNLINVSNFHFKKSIFTDFNINWIKPYRHAGSYTQLSRTRLPLSESIYTQVTIQYHHIGNYLQQIVLAQRTRSANAELTFKRIKIAIFIQ